MPSLIPLRSRLGKTVKPHKAIVSPQFDARTVLTEQPWEFVALWLKRMKQQEAVILWNQARELHKVSQGLSLHSAPLLLYYSFLNATKALLTSKRISFNPLHGVKADDLRGITKPIKLVNEGIEIKQTGILPSLSQYLNEPEPSRKHSMKDLLFNLPFVHRTYCLTYRSQRDMYVPLKDCVFGVDPGLGVAYLSANLSGEFSAHGVRSHLPQTLQFNPSSGPRSIRSTANTPIAKPRSISQADLSRLATLQFNLRFDLQHITGTETLWYAKLKPKNGTRIERCPVTITLAVMHRLSEICRYRPLELAAFTSSQESWLLSEFVRSAPVQFLDAVASEITGFQFLPPNVRPAN